MANTTATEPKPATNVTFTELNIKQDKGKPHFVRLHDSVVKGLEKYLKSSTGDSSGLLLGSIDVGENCTISVAEFEPAKIEDIVRSKTAHNVVGYYRTYSQAEFKPDSADRSLFQRSFPKEPRLVLLVRPPKTDVGTAMFFLGENGLLASDRATVEFPFNLRELGAEDSSPAPVPEIAKPAVSAKPAAPAVKPVVPAKPAPTVAVAAAKAPAALAAPKPVAENKASGGGSFWKIAVAGVVLVGSGLGLNSLGVFNRQTPSNVVAENPAPVAAEPAPAPQETDSGFAEPKKVTPQAALKPAAVEPLPKNPAPAVAAAPVRVTPPAETKPAPSAPPVVRSEPAVQTPPVSDPRPAATTPAPPAQAPAVREPIAEPGPPAATRPEPVSPPIQNARPAAAEPVKPYVAPRSIRQVAPVVPDNVRRSIEGVMTVTVRAYVDSTGKVTRVEPLTVGTPVADALGKTAIAAVQRWQFEPARRGTEKVAGDIELSFTFRK